jgi:hypothetical protein
MFPDGRRLYPVENSTVNIFSLKAVAAAGVLGSFASGPAYLVEDINPSEGPATASILAIVPVRDRLVLAFSLPAASRHGAALRAMGVRRDFAGDFLYPVLSRRAFHRRPDYLSESSGLAD